MPMKTTWVSRAPGSSVARAAHTCPTISPAVRFRTNPIVPVRQNAQPNPHPTWVETQSVRRSPSGMTTAWIFRPSDSRRSSLALPSRET